MSPVGVSSPGARPVVSPRPLLGTAPGGLSTDQTSVGQSVADQSLRELIQGTPPKLPRGGPRRAEPAIAEATPGARETRGADAPERPPVAIITPSDDNRSASGGTAPADPAPATTFAEEPPGSSADTPGTDKIAGSEETTTEPEQAWPVTRNPILSGPVAIIAYKARPPAGLAGSAIQIPFPGQVGAALFSRGPDAYVVFDERRPIDFSGLRDDPVFGSAVTTIHPGATVIHLTLPSRPIGHPVAGRGGMARLDRHRSTQAGRAGTGHRQGRHGDHRRRRRRRW